MIAKINWVNDRYELKIDGVLKAYTENEHEIGKGQLAKMAEDKGYTVHVENK